MLNEIRLVFENNDLVVINKPAGIITHPKNKTDNQPSVTGWVTTHYPALRDVGESFIASGAPMHRAGIVHRLDKDTSGLLVIAKNNDAFYFLKKQFQEHTIKKTYQALVYGTPREKSGTIDSPLGRLGMKRTTKIEGKKLIDGKESVTEYRVVGTYGDYSLLDVMPRTGRTHQIRVHLKSIGHPVVGDHVYAPKDWPLPLGLNRLFLHARKLTFATPDGQALTVETDLPPELERVLKNLQNKSN